MLNFIDKSFSTKKTSQYRLSIQVDLDGFSFCVYDSAQKKHVVLRHIPADFSGSQELISEKVSDIYNEIGWLSQSFISCSCVFISRKNTLIPPSYYNKETLATFLNFAYPLDEMDEVHYKISEQAQAVAIFAIPSMLASQLYTYHHNICFFNQCIPLIEYTLKQRNGIVMAINISNKLIDVAICRENRFIFHNTFSVSSAVDILYYIAFALKQLEIAPNDVGILLSGYVSNEVKHLLKANFARLSLSEDIVLPIAKDHITDHYLLLSLHECE